MNLPLKIARRYIFSKKSTNAINIISGISVLGIGIGSMALIIIMSVFNGFESLLGSLIGNFKPDIRITAVEGKVFVPDSSKIAQLKNLDGVLSVAQTIEEIALLEYQGVQNIGRIKGVEDSYRQVTSIDTCILEPGTYKTYESDRDVHYALVGKSLAYALDINVGQVFNRPLTVYMPKRTGKLSVSPTKKPFKQRQIYPSAVYAIQQSEYDNYAITNLQFVQELTSYKNGEISALELKLDPATSADRVQTAISAIMGEAYKVQNRYQQDEALYKITSLEKYVAFLIFAFTLVLVAFNMVGALWMLVLEKQQDISILKSMGATDGLVRKIFITEGFLLSSLGLLVGCIMAVILCYLQQTYGLVRLSGAGEFIIDAYPVEMRWGDFFSVILTVLLIGTAAAWIPAQRASKIGTIRQAH